MFGVRKNLYQQPPQLPPKPNGNVSDRGQGMEEEEEDDEEMYEPPPCNAQVWRKVTTPKKCTDREVYSDRLSSGGSPRGSNSLHPTPLVKLPGIQSSIRSKVTRQDSHPGPSSGSRPPDVPGKQAPPSATDRRLSLSRPVLPPTPRHPMKFSNASLADDLYLMPIHEKDVNLEHEQSPAIAAPAPSKGALSQKVPSPCALPSRAPPILKPSPALLPRTRPSKSPPAPLPRLPLPNPKTSPAPGTKLSMPKNLPPGFRAGTRVRLGIADTTPDSNKSLVRDHSTMGPTEDSGVLNKPWYGGPCERNTAESALQRTHKDGAFMVRDSSGHSSNQPYTLVVLYKGRVYNVPIRSMEGGRQYTLGKAGKNHEELFSNVSSIVQNFQENPLVLIGSCSSSKEQTCLLFPVRP